MQGVVHGPEDKFCPWWQKPMSEVCHKCPLWTKVSTETGDQYGCAVSWTALFALELIKESSSTSIEVNKLRNAVSGVGGGLLELARARGAGEEPRLIMDRG